MNATARTAGRWLVAACFALPWVTPYAGGPSSWVQPWLFAAGCAGVLLLAARVGQLAWGVPGVLAATAAWGFARSGIAPETLALAASCAVIAAAAWASAGGVHRSSFVRVVAWAWLVAALVSTFIALLQYFGVAAHFSPWVSHSNVGEAYANLRQRNQFATLTSIGIASLLWIAPRSRSRAGVWVAGAVLAIGNAATTSRTGLLQILAIGALALGWPGPRRERATLWAVLLVAFAVAAVGLPFLLERFTGDTGNRLWERVASVNDCSSRRVLWSNVLHLIAERPLLGWGWGELDYAHLVTPYPGPRFCDILDNAHNLPLHMAVELGLPFAVLLCAAFAVGIWRARPWREADAARQMAWAVLLAIALHSLVEYPLWYGPFQLAAGAALGMLAARGRREGAVAAPAIPWARLSLGAAALVAVAYASWDYHRVSQVYMAPEAREERWREDPIQAARQSWLFRPQANFADLTTTPLTRANARWTHELAAQALHYSPEPRVVEKVIESDVMLGADEEATVLMQRLRAAFPQDYAEWSARNHRMPRLPAAPDAATD